MAKIVPMQGVQPALLKWARETAHLTEDDVAQKIKKPVELIKAWEKGLEAPSYSQLERLAYELYKRPLAIFFFTEPPHEPKTEAEFRALPDADLKNLPRDTVLMIRRARSYQQSLLELFNDRSPVRNPIWKQIRLDVGAAIRPQAFAVRELLDVPAPGDNAWGQGDGTVALKIWRKAMEAGGVSVFKDTFSQKEISGFCLEHPELPLVMINNSTTKTRQIFSLLHELTHVLLMRRAISTFDTSLLRHLPPEERRVEIFCNKVSAEVLVPSDAFDTQIADLPQKVENRPEIFDELAEFFRVSREVILRRFRDADRVSQEFYEKMKKEWDGQKQARGSKGGSFYATRGVYLSERLMREVFTRYGRRQISIDEAADHIGVKPKQIDELESRYIRSVTE
jgi:Zn-dependent peptidase ImmA (M78 family)/transcriptional regulator with XRE-family HTH domain